MADFTVRPNNKNREGRTEGSSRRITDLFMYTLRLNLPSLSTVPHSAYKTTKNIARVIILRLLKAIVINQHDKSQVFFQKIKKI